MGGKIVILGVFVADATFRADRQPRIGETLMGRSFALGPGGKGSNQAVAAARAGGDVHFITRLGQDTFAEMALDLWREVGITPAITRHADSYTGAAFIFVEDATGNNAIIISPGVAGTIAPSDLDAQADLIAGASVFVTQLEQPMDAAAHGLRLARQAGARTILNPAPAAEIDRDMLALCDYITPNETEAEGVTGLPVTSLDDAARAGAKLVEMGAGAAVLTLGENGAYYTDGKRSAHVPAVTAGPVVETTGAGDAFNGAFAAALARDADPVDAVRFGCAAAGLSVTRPGTAPSMPTLAEIESLMAKG